MSKKEKQQERQKEQQVVRHRYESDMTRQERRLIEKEKLSTMDWKGKLGYLWTYYKFVLLIAAIVVLAVVFIFQTIENSRYNDILTIGVNMPAVTADNEKIEQALDEAIGTGEKYDRISLDMSYSMLDAESADYNMVMKFTTVVAAQGMDVLFTNEAIYEHYSEQEMFLDLTEILTPEQCEKLGIESGDDYLDVTDSNWVSSMQLVDYEPVYLTVIANTKNTEKVKEFIELVEEGK